MGTFFFRLLAVFFVLMCFLDQSTIRPWHNSQLVYLSLTVTICFIVGEILTLEKELQKDIYRIRRR